MKSLRQVSIIGLGLLGGSVALAVRQRMPGTAVMGYSHRPATWRRAKTLGIVAETAGNLKAAVAAADLVVLATPIFTFEKYFADLSGLVPSGCIVTDVGSTKMLPHEWAQNRLTGRLGTLDRIPSPARSSAEWNSPGTTSSTRPAAFSRRRRPRIATP